MILRLILNMRNFRWFGLILLPIVSFAADGCIAIVFFLHRAYGHFFGGRIIEPETLAMSRPIDLSIQFTLFWTPVLVLLGWWIDKPMHLMFGKCLLIFIAMQLFTALHRLL